MLVCRDFERHQCHARHRGWSFPPPASRGFPETPVLEDRVANGKRLIHDQDIGIYIHRNREREPDDHPGRVGAQGLVDEIPEFGEPHDLGVTLIDFLLRKPHDRAVHEHCPAGKIRVKPGSQFEDG